MPYLTIAKWVGGVLGGLLIAWLSYAFVVRPFTKPNPTTTQNGQNFVNYNLNPRVSFGCANFRIQKIPEEVATVVEVKK